MEFRSNKKRNEIVETNNIFLNNVARMIRGAMINYGQSDIFLEL